MVEIVTKVVTKVAECLVAPVGQQFSYIWNHETNFLKLETEFDKLNIKQKEVDQKVVDAERRSEVIYQHVYDWLGAVERKVNEASSEITQQKSEQENMKCFHWLCPNLKKLYQHSRKAEHMATSIIELLQNGNFSNFAYRNIAEETWIPPDFEAFESRKSTWEKLLEALSDPEVNIFGIYGAGGIGKTTLARAVAKHAKENEFHVVAFAEVTMKPDIGMIQVEIAEMLGLTFHESTVPRRASRLREYLKREERQKKKILLILDNIWATLELNKVGIPFGDECKGCKVLLTATDLDALKGTGSQLNLRMGVLNDQEAWKLFSTTAADFSTTEAWSNLQDLPQKVAKACGGLPIAIRIIAKALIEKEEYAWNNALHELKNPCLRTLKGVASEAFSGIEFSYNQLKDEELRSIFLLCSTMGSTYRAPIRDLVKYVMGLRLFKRINIIKIVRDRVDTLVGKLKDVSLLLDTPNKGSFSMYDVVRDVGRLIASREQHEVRVMDDNIRWDWDDDDTLKASTKIFLHNISELPKELECQHLEFLYMETKGYGALEIPNNFFTKMLKLRVLHLVGFDLLSLPTSFRLLVNLCTLCMDRCKVKDIALIGELENLEILSIDGDYYNYYMKMLPEEVCKLTRLRSLDLSQFHSLEEIPPKIIESLTKLQELYLVSDCIKWEVQGGRNASLDELKCLPHLTVLEIQIPNTDVLSKGLFCKNLEMYNINIGQRSKNYHFQLKWPKTSRKLELNLGDNCSCLEDVLHKTPSVKNVVSALDGGEGFPKLKQLWVHSSSCFRTVADCSESESYNPFPSLETLFLEELNNLEKIYNGQVGAEFLCQFRNINVKKCDKLKNIFSFSTIRVLPLEEIEVCDCANITEIFAVGKEEDIIDLKELRSMTLEGLPQLISFCSINNNEVILEDTPTATVNGKIYNGQVGAVFLCQFRNIKVTKCDKLKNIFSFSTIRALPLEKIEVCNCANITEIFAVGKEEDIIDLKELRFMTLEGLPQFISFYSINNNEVILEDTPTTTFNGKVRFPNLETLKLDMINSEQIWHHQLPAIPFCFQSLRELVVSSCHKLKYLFSSPTVVFPILEKIAISHMNNLETIWHNQLAEDSFRSLKSIAVRNCNKLLTIFNFNMLERDPQRKLSFQKLNNVKIGNCQTVKSIFPASIARNLSQLEQLDIYRCGTMEKIVAEEEGADLEAVTRFDFPRLTSLALGSPHQLRYFYPGRHTAEWPALHKLSISYCRELGLLASEENNEGQLNILVKPPLLFVKKGCFLMLEELCLTGYSLRLISQDQFSEHLIPKLKFLKVNYGESVFPPDILWRFPNLEKLEFYFGSYEEIFSLEEVEKHAERPAQIKSIQLFDLKELKRIWKQHSKLDLIIQKLEILHVKKCGLTDLLPTSAIFLNLQILHVEVCHKLTSILTSSTAKSLVQLTEMEIRSCDMLTEVVARDEGDVTKNKIIFDKLKTLILSSLSSLTNFCVENYTFEFPALEKLRVHNCTKMEIFCPGVLSTPKLNNLEGISLIREGDLNTTIQEMYRKRNKRTDSESSEEDGAGPSNQHPVLQNTESSEDGAGPSTQHLELFSCGTNKEGVSHIVEWNEDEGTVKRAYKGSEGSLPIGDSRNMEDVRSRLAEEVNNWRLTEINEPAQFRSLRLVSHVQADKIARLVYSNSGTRILALALNAIHLLWRWPWETNTNGKATTNVSPQLVQPKSGILMTNDLTNANPAESVPCFALSKNDAYLLSASGGKVSLFDMMMFRTVVTFGFPPAAPTYLAFHPADNNISAIGMDDSTIHIYNVRIDETKAILRGHSKRISCLAFSHVLNTLVSAGADAEMILWSTDNWERMKSTALNFPPGKTPGAMSNTQVQFHHNQTHFLAVNETQLAIYDAMKFECLNQWVVGGSLAPISHATFSGDSQLVYASFLDGALRIFTAPNLQLQCQINPSAYLQPRSPMFPTVVAAHPLNPNQFAVGLTDGGVYVFEPLESDGQWGIPLDQQAISSLRRQP